MVVVGKDQSIFRKIINFFLAIYGIIMLFFSSLFGMRDNSGSEFGRNVQSTGSIGRGGGGYSGNSGDGPTRRFPNVRGINGQGSGTTNDVSNCVSGGCCG